MRAVRRNPLELNVSAEIQVLLDEFLETTPSAALTSSRLKKDRGKPAAALLRLAATRDEDDQLDDIWALTGGAVDEYTTPAAKRLRAAIQAEWNRAILDLDQLAEMFHFEKLDVYLERGWDVRAYDAWDAVRRDDRDMTAEERGEVEQRVQDEFEREAIAEWRDEHLRLIERHFDHYGLDLRHVVPDVAGTYEEPTVFWQHRVWPQQSWEHAARNFDEWEEWQEDPTRYFSARDLVLENIGDVAFLPYSKR